MARAFLAIIVLGAGCGFQLSPATVSDAAGEGGARIDASFDATTDSGFDAPADSSVDAMIDAPVSTGVTFDGASSGAASFSNSLVVSHTVFPGSSRLLLVGVSTSYGGTTAVTVVYGTSALTRIGVRNAASLNGRVELWSLSEPPVGTANVTVALTDFASVVIAGAATFSGVDPVAPLGTLSTNIGTTGGPSVTVTSAVDEIAFGFVTYRGGYTTIVPVAPQVARWNTIVSPTLLSAASTRTGAASTTLSWTVTGSYDDYWAAAGIAVK